MPYRIQSKDELLIGVDEFLDEVTILPPGSWNPLIRIDPVDVPTHMIRPLKSSDKADKSDEVAAMLVADSHDSAALSDPMLRRSGRLFGGLIADIRRKAPFYRSDFTDALNMQCVATFFFMYFAILAPAVTFGGLLEEATGQRMAAIENVLSAALCGVTYHLFAGQPLTILGSTGPVLVFETLIHDMCKSYDLHYLSFRLWINVWMAAILLILVATDASCMVKYITRFTEESFAALIAVIFIVASVEKLAHIVDAYTKVTVFNPDDPNAVCFCTPPMNVSEAFDDWFPKVAKKHKWTPDWLANQTWAAKSQDGSGNVTHVDYSAVDLNLCTPLRGKLDGNGCYMVNSNCNLVHRPGVQRVLHEPGAGTGHVHAGHVVEIDATQRLLPHLGASTIGRLRHHDRRRGHGRRGHVLGDRDAQAERAQSVEGGFAFDDDSTNSR